MIVIHYHGIFQEGSSWDESADGPIGVTHHDCLISPGNSFAYQFNVPDQAETFWYHWHLDHWVQQWLSTSPLICLKVTQ